MRWIAIVMMCAVSGCGLFDSHVKQMDVLNGMAVGATERLGNGSMSQIQASGQALNPGVTVEASVVYRATAKYDGLAGQFAIAAQGQLSDRISYKDIEAIYRDKTLTDEQRAALVKELIFEVLKTAPNTEPEQ